MALKLGILGAGRIGRIHIENALRHSEIALVAVCEPNPEPDRMPKWLYADEEKFWDLDMDAVIIASPTESHAPQALRAISLGKHVFCEKPLHRDLTTHRQIKKALDNSGLIFQMGFNRRFDPDFSAMAMKVRASGVGIPYYLRITSRDPKPPSLAYLRSSGGMFFDMSIHDFDMARFIMASEVDEVFALGAALINKEIESINDIDTAIITLKFANGSMGVIDNSRQALYGYDQRIEIFGSLSSLRNDNIRRSTLSLSDALGTHREALLDFFMLRYVDSYRAELAAFVSSCLLKSAPQVSIDDAIMAVSIAHAASTSLKEQRPVKLAEFT